MPVADSGDNVNKIKNGSICHFVPNYSAPDLNSGRYFFQPVENHVKNFFIIHTKYVKYMYFRGVKLSALMLTENNFKRIKDALVISYEVINNPSLRALLHDEKKFYCTRCKKVFSNLTDKEVSAVLLFDRGECHDCGRKTRADNRQALAQEEKLEREFHGNGMDPENLRNLGPTGHGDICYSDADNGL